MINENPSAPAARTRPQQAHDLAQQQAVAANQQKQVSTHTQQLYYRYMAGELQWEQVRTFHNT